ncbi:hypothetical protein [Burkholderia pseudomallei]|uniref:hypothetical protein n=1 Tax=Burkholderia pseudomallei TaxID=28450 RepID=UPI00161AA9CE|nr:hypothetical protein [Burkholderia pseudomallei]
MEDPLSSDKLKAIAQSVLLRCEYLATMFGSDAPMTARTGLVTLNRTIYLLATRYLGDPVEPFVLSADIRANRDLPPTNRASRSLVKFVFGEEDEHEEALYGTTNHQVSEGSRGRYAGQGTVQEAWVQ